MSSQFTRGRRDATAPWRGSRPRWKRSFPATSTTLRVDAARIILSWSARARLDGTMPRCCTIIGANGVEGGRQKTPPNAVEVAKMLLDAGAEVDALADLYESKCTTMSMLVSSSHPAESGSAGGARRNAARLRRGTRWTRVELAVVR